MMIVTEISICKNNQTRANVFLDGAFAFSLSAELAVTRGVKKGASFNETEIEAIKAADEEARAIHAALQFVSYKLRSRQEVLLRLEQKGFSQAAAKAAAKALEKTGYIDDENYAMLYAEDLSRRYGRRMIASRLAGKGIGRELADRAMDALPEKNAALAGQTERLVQKHGRGSAARQKIFRTLMGRGFSPDEIGEALKQGEDE